MPHPYDASTKYLSYAHVADWLTLAGLPTGNSIKIVDADLSTVSAAADKLFVVEGPSPYAAHYEFQAGPDDDLDMRTLKYNVLSRDRLKLPVKSVVFALRRQAITKYVKGYVSDTTDPSHELQFRYKLIRVWEFPPEKLLGGGLGTLPLAPISDVTEAQLPAVIEAMARRFEAEAAPAEIGELWTATRVLMGLKWSDELVVQLLKGATQMRESVTYQAILEEGRMEARGQEARALLLRRGTRKFGPPDAAVRSRLESIEALQTLEDLTDRILDGEFKTWAEALPPTV